MIQAMVLCAHLVAAHAVTHCTKAGPSDAAKFDTPSGSGLVFQLSDGAWAAEADPVATYGRPGLVVVTAPYAHVVIVAQAPLPDQAKWWIDSIALQSFERAEVARYSAAIARERANPAGVVDLDFLHDLGDALAFARERLATNAAEYLRTTGLKIPVGQ